MSIAENAALLNVFSGDHYWNKDQWHLVWETEDAHCLSLLIPRESDNWKEDWASLVLLGRAGSTDFTSADSDSLLTMTLMDCVPAQEILCNTVLAFRDKRDKVESIIMKSIPDCSTETQVLAALRSISNNKQVRNLRLKFSAHLLDGGPSEVFKSDRDMFRSEKFNRRLLVNDRPDQHLWQI